ncbi:MAG: inositol monophosphatase, partial [Desulfobulbaceae bacterium]|nr:inositol monophosphatase [Desulfobulbaceae bacterium]
MQRLNKILATIPDRQLAAYLQSAAKAALAGGKIVKDLFNQPHAITMKGAIDLVTEADPASEAAILEILSADFPDIPNMAEESAQSKAMPEHATWVIDPLDGTTNYAHGFPVFGVSV